MKRYLLLTPFLSFLLAFNLQAQFSNASISGPWIVRSDNYAYIIFDGNGTIKQIGTADDTVRPVGTYSVQADGSFTGVVNLVQGSLPVAGTVVNDTFATFTDTTQRGPKYMFKVTNTAALSGSWSGYVLDSTSNAGRTVGFTVNDSGVVTAATGLPLKAAKIFTAKDTVAAFVVTTDANCIYTVIQFSGVYNDSITGRTIMGPEGSSGSNCNANGHISLSRTATGISNISAPLQINIYPNPFNDILFITTTAGELHAEVYDLLGAHKATRTISGSNGSIDMADFATGVYLLQLSDSNGNIVTRKIVKQ